MAETDLPHPIAHIDPEKCYEWMLAQCASHEANRQAREDGLVTTITQISSAALLVIPGLFFSSDSRMPPVADAPLIYAGISLFLLALVLSMLEQHFSAKAYERQVEITQNYYLKKSLDTHDAESVKRVRLIRMSTYVSFSLAIVLSTFAMMMIH